MQEDDNAEAGPSHYNEVPTVTRHSDDEDAVDEASAALASDIPTPESVSHPVELEFAGRQSPIASGKCAFSVVV